MNLPGCYKARVTNNIDPMRAGRLKLQIPQVFQLQETNWAEPSRPWAANFNLPGPGTIVWCMFEAGDSDHPVWFS